MQSVGIDTAQTGANVKCIVIDDEFSARSRLKRLLATYPDMEVIGEAEDGIEGLERVCELKPELIFLDIEMPRLNGFQMLRALPTGESFPLIVFVTGYDEHALAAFEADALAYLLKPVEPQRLASVLNRARQLVQNPIQVTDEKERIVEMVQRAPVRLDQLVGRRQGRFVLLRPTEILFFSADLGVVKAHTAKDTFHVEMTLNELEESLSGHRFFRAHRSTLVNLAHVREIEPHFRSSYILTMADGAHSQIQVSERQAKLLREKIPGL
jgi:two-component system, LytTR family, response regulator